MKNFKTKDYIFAGAFAAIFIVFIVVMMTVMSFNPITELIGPCVTAIIGGPIFFLYVTKVPKRGALLISSVLMSLIMISTSILPMAVCIAVGLIAEILAFIGKYSSKNMYTLAYGFFGIGIMSPFSIIFVARATYLAKLAQFYGQAYADTIDSITSNTVLIGLFILAFISGIIGAFLGRKILKKHFEKAEIV